MSCMLWTNQRALLSMVNCTVAQPCTARPGRSRRLAWGHGPVGSWGRGAVWSCGREVL